MKNMFSLPLLLLLFLMCGMQAIQAQNVSVNEAIALAGNFLSKRLTHISVKSVEPFQWENDTLAWVVNCQPRGFVVIAPDKLMTPVIAWSDEGDFGSGEAWNTFNPVFRYDLKIRKEFAGSSAIESELNRQQWDFWLNPENERGLFEQWPPENWSPTGGWLFTNWTQTSPYNALCPVDGQTHTRSVAGCPATAMAQIVHFHHKLNDTRFSDADDYYHNFGAGNMYWIDNDWETYGFPSWPDLNVFLDTLQVHYESGSPLSNTDKAALTYACGAAAKQVYSSSVSGTYGINQAYNAFVRFGYNDSQLIYPTNPQLNELLADNIKLALPAQLGLVNPQETAGHNVVVDGYNTDEFYHFNFGWGGSANGWYTMPPISIPYDLTVIEGVVLDINLSDPPVGIALNDLQKAEVKLVYNRLSHCLQIESARDLKHAQLTVFDISGRLIFAKNLEESTCQQHIAISSKPTSTGICIARLVMADGKTNSIRFLP